MASEGFADFAYPRDYPFSYKCNRCMRCCYGKRIPLNPYDLVRLAEVLGKSTGEVLEEHTDNGVLLKVDDEREGAPCIFLGPEGCGVHQGRPGACRVYPLGRTVQLNGNEGFAFVQPHPETEGEYGEMGTIATYLAEQNLAPYFAASEAYMRLFQKLAMADVFEDGDGDGGLPETSELLDVDKVVADYCAEQGRPAPTDSESKYLLHIKAIEAMIPDSV